MSLRVPRPIRPARALSGALLGTTLALGLALAPSVTPAGSPTQVGPAAAATAARLADAEPPSTPVPILTPEGRLSSYVVNGVRSNGSQNAALRQAVRRAGGTVVAAWPQIGVVVAHSTRATFRDDVLAAAPDVVDSVGATRTIEVSEGTPSTAQRTDAARVRKVSAPARDRASGRGRAVVPDPREPEQWDLRMIGADRAHETTDGSRRVVVGVLDSGIDPDHPDLRSNLDPRLSVDCTDAGRLDRTAGAWAPTTSDHGTHVAGTIAAARNGVGIVGVAPGVRLASVKVVNDGGLIYPEYAVCGFMWAGLQGLDITNNSYYVDPFMYYCGDQPDQAAAMESVARAVRWSHRKGVAHVAAAGNAATDLATNTTDSSSPGDGVPVNRTINSGCLDIPAELPDVVTVSSVARVGQTLQAQLSNFSNRGFGIIDVTAPGSSILSTVVAGNGYGLKSGTSMATPHVAGVLALMASVHPGWSPARLAAELEADAVDLPCAPPQADQGDPCVGDPADNSYAGEGIVDAAAAVR